MGQESRYPEMEKKIGLITCGALGKEVREIIERNQWDAKMIGIPSIYHLYPNKITPAVHKKLVEARAQYDMLAVVYGDCGTHGELDALLEQYRIKRIPTMNCYEMYAGELAKQLLKEQIGTYFLTDFLVATFDSSVIHGLGLDKYPQLKHAFSTISPAWCIWHKTSHRIWQQRRRRLRTI